MERATQERLVGATLLIVAGVVLIPWLLDGSMTEPGVNEQELVLPGGNNDGNETRRISLDVPGQSGSGVSGSSAPVTARNQPVPSPSNPVTEIDSRSIKSVDEPAAMALPKPKTADVSSEVPARFSKPMPSSASVSVPAATSSAPEVVVPKPVPPKPAVLKPVDPVAEPPPRKEAMTAEVAPAPDTAAPAARPPSAQAGSAWAVQVGSFARQENAERLAARLIDKSYQAFVMRNVVEGRVRFRVRVGPVNERNQAELLATALREDRQPARVLAHP